jgi:hypothetical protein
MPNVKVRGVPPQGRQAKPSNPIKKPTFKTAIGRRVPLTVLLGHILLGLTRLLRARRARLPKYEIDLLNIRDVVAIGY